uniref:Uncharacterized protein n=1 Tax=Anopheles dirus TaxID=7168 RepID=A0A182NVE7_9DIPT
MTFLYDPDAGSYLLYNSSVTDIAIVVQPTIIQLISIWTGCRVALQSVEEISDRCRFLLSVSLYS